TPARSARLAAPDSSSAASRRPMRRARAETIAPIREVSERMALHALRLRRVDRRAALRLAPRRPGAGVRLGGPPAAPPPPGTAQPRPTLDTASPESAHAAGPLEPGRPGHVLGGATREHPQVPQHRGLERQPQRREPGLLATARCGQGVREVAVIHLTDPVTLVD